MEPQGIRFGNICLQNQFSDDSLGLRFGKYAKIVETGPA